MAKDARADGWAKGVVSGVGEAMKKARAGGRTAAWLSKRTGELGYEISPTVIAKLESGHRGEILNLPELLIIAAALDVPPLTLLYPNVLDEVELLPDKTLPGVDALGWFTGAGVEWFSGRGEPFALRGAQSIQVALQIVTVERNLEVQRHNLRMAENMPDYLGDDETMNAYEQRQAEVAKDNIAKLETRRKELVHAYKMLIGRGDA